jgi:hypothetical protein
VLPGQAPVVHAHADEERPGVDDGGHPLDVVARACLQLADVIEEDVDRGSSPEPIELGRLQVGGLRSYVLRDFLVPGPEEMTELQYALRRFRDGSV